MNAAAGAHLAPQETSALIFDMDGLIVDSEPFWRRVETEVFDEIGVDIRPLIGHGYTMGLRVDEVVALFRARLGFVEPSDDELAIAIVDGVVAAIRNEGTLLPGAIDALDFCAEHGWAAALASGSTPPVIDAVLDRFGLASRFDVVCSAEQDALGKPHPAIFLRAAIALGVEPSTCVVLEDSLNGCIAARAAKMRVIAVPDARHAHDARFSIADLVLTSLAELRGERSRALLGLAPVDVESADLSS